MPFCDYLPEQMGSATLSPAGPFVAGSFAELTLVYTAGFFGIDDSGMMKVSWRTTSDMGKPQFDRPDAPNYTSVEASNGAVLDCRFDRVNIRPWTNTLVIRVDRGFLKAGDTITVRFGDRRRGSPGIRLQTNAEGSFEFKIYVDAFAAYEFTEIPASPTFALIPGAPSRWKAILPSLVERGEKFRLALLAEDKWGNPTDQVAARLSLEPSRPIASLPLGIDVVRGRVTTVLEGLSAAETGDIDLALKDESGAVLCRANPMRVVENAVPRRYWGDLHGQSEETVGTNSADEHFAFARDRAFLDIVGHQGNDFQITDAFWRELNRLTAAYDKPGRFLAIPGFEWSGNTGLGGDRNVFYRREGRPIHRSSHILVRPEETSTAAQHTAHRLFEALKEEDAVVVAHVGGRYADIAYAHDPQLETSVEVHSSWGTFEWLLHDALAKGHRVGVICHSDDHKGRPGATHPGASSFGAIGGLTCYLMPELTRDALFEALRRRHHYGTTGTRIFLDVQGRFAAPVKVYRRDPRHGGDAAAAAAAVAATVATMGDIVGAGGATMRLEVEAIGTAPLECVDVFHGKKLAASIRPKVSPASRRLRLRWQGAEYRGRGRQTLWHGEAKLEGNRYARAAAVNFLNPELELVETQPNAAVSWRSVTTGNMAGIDFLLEDAAAGTLRIDTNLVQGQVSLAALGDGEVAHEAGGLDRRLTLRRLPDEGGPMRLAFTHEVRNSGNADLPVYVRVTQEDGHQAWSSPIYLIA
jgi:hypothetical protein